MKSWLVVSLLAVVFGLAASSDKMAASAIGQHHDEMMDMMLANVGRDLVTAAKMPTGTTMDDADDIKNNNNKIRRAASTTTTPYSASYIQWFASSTPSCAAASPTVTISCATGGTISLEPGTSGVSKCTKIGTNTLKCTKTPSSAAADVSVKCTGKYTVTATLPKLTFTGCKNNVKGHFADQVVTAAQACAIKAGSSKYTTVYSKQCGVASQLFVGKPNSIPSCQSNGSKCVNTTKTTCSITTDAVEISTPASSLCILK